MEFWNCSEQSGSLLACCVSATLSRVVPWTTLMWDSCEQLQKSSYGDCLQRENFHNIVCVTWKLPRIYVIPVSFIPQRICRKRKFIFLLCWYSKQSIILLFNLLSFWSKYCRTGLSSVVLQTKQLSQELSRALQDI